VVECRLLIIVLYIEDLILIGDEKLIKSYKEDFTRYFEMKYLGLIHYLLCMEAWKRCEELFVSQGMYANKILKKFHMESKKCMEIPLASN